MRHFGRGLLALLGIILLTFCVTTLWVDPARLILPHSSEEIVYEQYRQGLYDSVPVQFLHFLTGAVRLDFGLSLWQRRPAIQLVGEHLGATVWLALMACSFAILLGFPCGALAACKSGTAFDRLCTILAMIALSVADFWLGLLAVLCFSLLLSWLPIVGKDSYAAIFPALTLAVRPAGQIMLATRTALLDAMRQPYIVTARAKGLGEMRVIVLHAFKNVVLALLPFCGYELGRIFSGYAFVVETIFARPGLGQLLVQALHNDDIPVMQAVLFVVAALGVLLHVVIATGTVLLRKA